ncbi:MAG TPA: HAMP domain-containing sensor histidine kinase [Cyclobacteriaceae bacterium]|nr:HAMP domain-containing sensor histidine kinase [Cyclobacteriaceae bacterium]
MSEIFTTQTPFLYLAQFALALGIGFMLTFFHRTYGRVYLRTWSHSAYTYCVHALAFTYLTSAYSTDALLRSVGGLISATFNHIHIVFLFMGVYEAIHQRSVKRNSKRSFIAVGVGLGLITTAAFAIDPKDFILQVGWLDFITGISIATGGMILLLTRSLRGIGVKMVGGSFVGYGTIHLYDLYTVATTLMGDPTLLPQTGIVKLVLIACIGFGLVIWLLEDEQELLRKTNRELDSFIYSTSHDLRAPVASLLGLLNVARKEVNDRKALDFLNLIEDRTQKLDDVVGDILNLARAKKSELRYENVDFNALLADSMSDVKYIDSAKKIELRYFESPGNQFIGDYSLTKMVLGNLLSNAIKYHSPSKPDPYIEVQFEKTAGHVSFVVADNGEGIDVMHQGKIFDMFYRASEKSKGTGLGLYIVKETLARIGGSVEVESKKGKGTSFRITLEQPVSF